MLEKFLDELTQHFEHQATQGQITLMHKLSTFILNQVQDEIFIIKGYAGTGKTTLISAVIKSLRVINYQSVLLAPTGRAAKVLSLYSGKLAFTIHKKIYKPISKSDSSRAFVLQPNLHKNTIFIVDEASMIGDDRVQSEGKLFGAGSLLEDLLMYVYQGENCKLVLIGDTAQLPPVGMNESPALSADNLKRIFHCSVYDHELTEVVRQMQNSGILSNATQLRNMIRENNQHIPQLQLNNYKDIRSVSGIELEEAINTAYNRFGDDNTIIICRSNKRANIYNREIRSRIKFYDDSINTGDYLMVVKNNYFWLDNKDRNSFIANGDIAEVVRIKKRNIEMFGFKFADVTLRLIDYPEEPEFDAKIILDTIDSEHSALTFEQNNALYNAVMEYYSDVAKKSTRVAKVKQDPYFNALQVKFAYAITCHKAQGGQWKAVFVEQGYLTNDMINLEFKRWLYTAITRAETELYLINFNKDFFAENTMI
ncbi:MAG: AAA family ATPase [Bacteroidia bacterium]|nr:AAA family ATPase [Bacteroidia bacterium]MCZ2249502.1 AAA family ATPase [Bacteroidia bacterium]